MFSKIYPVVFMLTNILTHESNFKFNINIAEIYDGSIFFFSVAWAETLLLVTTQAQDGNNNCILTTV